MRRIVVIGAVAAVGLAAGLASLVAFQPSPTQAAGFHATRPTTTAAV
jgi:hypothetical protein